MNCQVTSSDINRSRIHLRGGKRKKNAKPARFPCGALNARKFTVVSREPASFLSFSYFFLFLQLFLFASSSSPFLHLVPFLFSFFFFTKKKRKAAGSSAWTYCCTAERGRPICLETKYPWKMKWTAM